MTVEFYRLQDDDVEYEQVAVVEDGAFIDGEENVPPIPDAELRDEERLVHRYDGPRLIATQADPDTVKAGSEPLNLLTKDKAWRPYEGPQGGQGWEHVGTGEIRYQQHPPGEVIDEYDDAYWENKIPDPPDGFEWDDDIPNAMHEGDLILYQRADGSYGVGVFEDFAGFEQSNIRDDKKDYMIRLQDGGKIGMFYEAEGYAPVGSRPDPPEIDGVEWERPPDSVTDYGSEDLVYYERDGSVQVGFVNRTNGVNEIRVTTPDRYDSVSINDIVGHADPVDGFNVGYAIMATPFDNAPEFEGGIDQSRPGDSIASKLNLDARQTRSALREAIDYRQVDRLENRMNDWEWAKDDPDNWIRGVKRLFDNEESRKWESLKHRLRNQATGVAIPDVKRFIEEAWRNSPDPIGTVEQEMLSDRDRNEHSAEQWLRVAAQVATEDDFLGLPALQNAVDRWSRDNPFDPTSARDHLDPANAESVVALSDTDAQGGISAGAMWIAEYDDGSRAFVTRTAQDGTSSEFAEDEQYAKRVMVGYEVQSALNDDDDIHYPEHQWVMDEYYTVEGAPRDAITAKEYEENGQMFDSILTPDNDDVWQSTDLPDDWVSYDGDHGVPRNDIADIVGADIDDLHAAMGDTFGDFYVDQVRNDTFGNGDYEDTTEGWTRALKDHYGRKDKNSWTEFMEDLEHRAKGGSPVDRSTYLKFAAQCVLAGNRDMHHYNVLVSDDGIHGIDLDFAGFDMSDSTQLEHAITKLADTANAIGLEASTTYAEQHQPSNDHFAAIHSGTELPIAYEILDYVEQYARDVDEGELSRLAAPYDHSLEDNVKGNVEAAKSGDLSWE